MPSQPPRRGQRNPTTGTALAAKKHRDTTRATHGAFGRASTQSIGKGDRLEAAALQLLDACLEVDREPVTAALENRSRTAHVDHAEVDIELLAGRRRAEITEQVLPAGASVVGRDHLGN